MTIQLDARCGVALGARRRNVRLVRAAALAAAFDLASFVSVDALRLIEAVGVGLCNRATASGRCCWQVSTRSGRRHDEI